MNIASHGELGTREKDFMIKIFVKDIKDKDLVESVFLVRQKASPLAKNGKPYLALMLADKTGSLDGRMWDNVEGVLPTFQQDDFVRVKGVANLYQKRLQLVISQIEKITKKDVKIEDFLLSSQFDAEVMFKNLMMIVAGIKNKYIKQLITETLEDPEIKPRYMKCPAARSIHHAWVGGLLEHTLSICKIMLFMGTHYENVDVSLLIFGAIFHDIGKLWELDFDTNTSYTNAGKLIGHLVMGAELVERKTKTIKNFPDDLKIVCKHIVLSHHGKLEYGSPKLPQTLEAYIVSSIDELDSKITALQTFMAGEKAKSASASWSGYSSVFDRYFYLDRPGQAEPS